MQYGGEVQSGPGIGYTDSQGSVYILVPFTQTPGQSLGFVDGRFGLSFDGADPSGSVVVGYRSYIESWDATFAGYGAFDIRDTGLSTFSQLGTGVELLGQPWEARLNAYFPVGNRINEVGSFTTTPRFRNQNLVYDAWSASEEALGGFDLEAGATVYAFDNGGAIRLLGGTYYVNGDIGGDYLGWQARAVVEPIPGLDLGVGIRGDGLFGTNVFFGVSYTGPSPTPPDSVTQRLARRLEREELVAVAPVARQTSDVLAINPDTGQVYVFEHVSLGGPVGNGTIETPHGEIAAAIAASTAGEIVYVDTPVDPGQPGFTIPDGVTVLSTGPTQTVNTQFGEVVLPGSGTGVLPTITGSIQMGNATLLSGFFVNPGINQSGIIGTGVTTAVVRDNVVQVTHQNGAGLTGGIFFSAGSSDILVTNNTVTAANDGGGGIAGGIGTFSVANVRVTNNTVTLTNANLRDAGMGFVDSSNLLVADNTVNVDSSGGRTTNPVEGIAVYGINGTTSDITLTGNTVSSTSSNTARSIFLSSVGDGNFSNVTVSGNTITAQADRTAVGIDIEVRDGSQLSNASLVDNTITTSGANAPGIRLRAFRNATVNDVLMANNRISTSSSALLALPPQSGVGAGIQVLVGDPSSSQDTASISGLEIVDNQFETAAASAIALGSVAGPNSSLCAVNISGNSVGTFARPTTFPGITLTGARGSNVSLTVASAAELAAANEVSGATTAVGQFGSVSFGATCP